MGSVFKKNLKHSVAMGGEDIGVYNFTLYVSIKHSVILKVISWEFAALSMQLSYKSTSSSK